MPFSKTLKREFEVAFAKSAQPVWFRILKYLLIGYGVYFLWGTRLLWVCLPGLLALSLAAHFWYRRKTKGWTRSYGMWKHDSPE